MFVQIDGVSIEVPRLVKKPGEYKAVHTEPELRDALAEGWVLRLTEPVDTVADAKLVTEEAAVLASERADAEPAESFTARLAALSAKDAIAVIESHADVADLQAAAKVEARATVERALEKRLDELQ